MTVAIILALVALVGFFFFAGRKAQRGSSAGSEEPRRPLEGAISATSPPPAKRAKSPQTSVFKPFDAETLGSSELENYLRDNEKSNAFYFVGALSSGRPFAVLIGFAVEWLNVVALNRAQKPEYQRYGYNLREKRWSSGSPPLGAPEIRELVENARPEIVEKIALLEPTRQERAARRAQHEAREAEEHEAEKAELEAERLELRRVQEARAAALKAHFGGLSFKFNGNKARHRAAQKAAETHYCHLDLENQACTCEGFASRHAAYPTWDIRRLCSHLSYLFSNHSLLARSSDPLHQFILEELLHDVAGLYIGTLAEGKKFGIVVHRDKTTVSVATPRVKEEGFVRTTWNFRDGAWSSGSCSKTFALAIQEKLAQVLPE